MLSQLVRRCLASGSIAFLCAIIIGLAAFGVPKSAVAQSESLVGTWSLVWEGARDNYTGTLTVATKVNDTVYKAKLKLLKSNGDSITEDASITVSGKEIRIECSNPSVKSWNPDRFYVVRDGNRMEGYSLDTAGQRGRKIVLNKR